MTTGSSAESSAVSPAVSPAVSSTVSLRGVTKSYGPTPVLRGIEAEVGAGEVLVLLGPSGCGKTTLLRLIAGLDALDAGEVRVDGATMSSVSVHVPTERRRIGMVFQDGALFPHLSVARNVGFGLPRADRRAGPRIDEMLDLVGLGGFGDRMPDSLSGGQRQRVALARALAPAPRILLMDEPFSNLDAVLRARLRREVRSLLAGMVITTIFVTHDRDEAFALADRVAVMGDGILAQIDRPRNIYERPASSWLASFVGDGTVLEGTVLEGTDRSVVAETVLGPMPVHLSPGLSGGPGRGEAVSIIVRPEFVELVEAPAGVPGVVTAVEYGGGLSTISVRLDRGPTVLVRVVGVADRALERGDAVRIRVVEGTAPPVAFPPSA